MLRARPAPPGVNGDLLVELVVSVEERRTQIMLDAGRKECAELLEISGAEEFVRTVGEEDQMCLGLKMFHPKNDIIENFEILMMFVLLFVFMTLPLCLAFDRVNTALLDINFACDLIFCLDVVKNCNVGYVDDRGVVVMDRKMALKNYFQTWALIDIVSSVPIDRVMDAATEGKEDGGGVMGSKKILKLLRLVRMTKLVKLLRASQLDALKNGGKQSPRKKLSHEASLQSLASAGTVVTADDKRRPATEGGGRNQRGRVRSCICR